MPNKKSPRREILSRLRTINKLMRGAVARWNVSSRIDKTPSERGGYGPEFGAWDRPREHHEFPENRVASWKRLSEDMETVIDLAYWIKQYAYEQICELEDADPETAILR